METIDDVISFFNNSVFVLNPILTVILYGGTHKARIFAIINYNKKYNSIIEYKNKHDYMSYLRED